ncbi:MAG: glycoside hydrolase family 38 C-terminal domain-containing protein [Acidobacteriia bacterium]|nr:glycoside hydrolase family 38 C-terminal domain-containing protein [Terriglobia bacterium]
MLRSFRLITIWLFLLGLSSQIVWGQTAASRTPDFRRQPTLYVVPYAHLDTQWRWDYPQVIREFLPKTLHDNFALFEKYPHYIFNFSGANRYRLMKEYYPADYARLQHYVAAGRWFPSGSSMEENDVNNPSAESIIRQILYGKEYFRHDFGKTSAEYMLPDCFGFPASLPSILAHAGIKGFSTQKLSWHSGTRVGGPDSPEDTPVGIPFNVGIWDGPDGRGVIAALNATDYSGDITEDISKSPPPPTDSNARNNPIDWPKRVQKDGEASGLFVDYRYYGTGDIGGAPRESSVKMMEAILTKSKTVLPPPRQRLDFSRLLEEPPPPGSPVLVGDGPLHIIQSTAEQMFLDIRPDQTTRMPRYKGDLELTEHSAGSLTSEAYMKRWNRKNELLADAAEEASVAASWLTGRAYPLERLNHAWTLVMGGQFHDIIPGTSIPKAYEYSWNDQVLAMNQFATVLRSGVNSAASSLNTEGPGIAIVVLNPLNIERQDVVEAHISFPQGMPKAVRVVGPDGKEVPSQVSAGKVLFLAKVPSVGFSVFDVQSAESPAPSHLRVTESSLENARYLVKLDGQGDVSSIFDKNLKREILSAPIRLAFKLDRPVDWPAWNMDWADQQKPPRAYVGGPARTQIVENGAARIAIRVEREAEGSKFIQIIRLSEGDAGNRLEFVNTIDWKTGASNLKAVFPLVATNALATYNWDIGTIRRHNDDEKMFEFPSHQWFDLTDRSGSFGVTILSDCKNGSDKPSDNTLQLTLLRTPGIGTGNGQYYSDQATQDWGHHEMTYGLASHGGDYRAAQTDWEAYRLNQPLIAFESPKHTGFLGKEFSLIKVNNERIRVLALKRAEAGKEIIVRMVEMGGEPQPDVRVAFSAPIISAREVNGAEEAVGPATVSNGALVTPFGPYQPRTFALKLESPRTMTAAPEWHSIKLTYDLAAASADGSKSAPGFDSVGRALPAEQLPTDIAYGDIHFQLAAPATSVPDALIAKGQTIPFPAGKTTHLFILAASAEGDQEASFLFGQKQVGVTIQDWQGFIGQWDNRIWKTIPAPPLTEEQASRLKQREAQVEEALKQATARGDTHRVAQLEDLRDRLERPRTTQEFAGLTPGFVKPAPVAWFATHHHTADGANEPYAYVYLFAYDLAVPANAKTVTLPYNDKIRILAMTVSNEGDEVHPVQPLFDTLTRTAK